MSKEDKRYNIGINRSNSRSRFLVDLNYVQKASKRANKKYFTSFSDLFSSADRGEKLDTDFLAPEIELEKSELETVSRQGEEFSQPESFKKYANKAPGANWDWTSIKIRFSLSSYIYSDWWRRQYSKMGRLAFFVLAKLIIDIGIFFTEVSLRLSYFVGWAAVFFLRLTGSILWYPAKPLAIGIIRVVLKAGQFLKNIDYTKPKRVAGANLAAIKTKTRVRLGQTMEGYKEKASAGWESISQKTGQTAADTQKLFNEQKSGLIESMELIGGFLQKFYQHIENWSLWQIKPRDLLPRPRLAFVRPAVFFFFAIAILILPFKGFTYYRDINVLKGRVMGVSEAGINDLINASESIGEFNFGEASQNFASAKESFIEARSEIKSVNSLLKLIAPLAGDKNIKLASQADLILSAGQIGSDIGQNLSRVLAVTEEPGEKNIGRIISEMKSRGKLALDSIYKLAEVLDQINPEYIPAEYKDSFSVLKNKLGMIAGSLEELVELAEYSREFLGFDYDKRYLLVFQNNTEMRASGGFIGSFALIDFRDGKIKKIEAPTGGSYDTTAGMLEEIISPEPLHLVNPRWYFWDANWWPDWPTSARQLMRFYEHSDGSTVDGVISFTPTVMEKILAVVGPIDLGEEYGVVVDKNNFWPIVQAISERKPSDFPEVEYFKRDYVPSSLEENELNQLAKYEPKKIIGDLMQALIERLTEKFDRDTFLGLLGVIDDNLSEKQVMLYLKDMGLERKAADLGWTGQMRQTSHDYLMVVNSNISGGKSDKAIKQEIKLDTEVLLDGSIINELTIRRTHTALRGAPFTGVRNTDWMRIYVPEGSELIEAEGFNPPDSSLFEDPGEDWTDDPFIASHENLAKTDKQSQTKIYDEFNKTVFANWMQLEPGETATIRLRYKLPFKLVEEPRENEMAQKYFEFMKGNEDSILSYSLLAQKQPGQINSDFSSILKLPPDYEIIKSFGNNINYKNNSWAAQSDLARDSYWGVVILNNN